MMQTKVRLFYKEVDGEIVWSYIISESKTNRGLKIWRVLWAQSK